jgi:hypothetical protein
VVEREMRVDRNTKRTGKRGRNGDRETKIKGFGKQIPAGFLVNWQ